MEEIEKLIRELGKITNSSFTETIERVKNMLIDIIKEEIESLD